MGLVATPLVVLPRFPIAAPALSSPQHTQALADVTKITVKCFEHLNHTQNISAASSSCCHLDIGTNKQEKKVIPAVAGERKPLPWGFRSVAFGTSECRSSFARTYWKTSCVVADQQPGYGIGE